MNRFLLLLSVFVAFSAGATCVGTTESKPAISSRLEKFALKPEVLFYPAKTSLDQKFYQAGLLHHWQMYGKTETPDAEKFKGYILYGDPYHRGLKRISFLLGADCSDLVYRIFQMAGASFPFLKTRHWIHLSEALKSNDAETYFKKQNASNTPLDLKLCVWKAAVATFKRIENEKDLEIGDIVVYPKSEGILGMKGHMGFVSAVKPAVIVLQSKYPVGITALPIEKNEHHFLRYTGELSPSAPASFQDALNATYPEKMDAAKNCADEGGSA